MVDTPKPYQGRASTKHTSTMCDCVQIPPTSTYPWLGNFLFLFETGQYQYDRVPYSSNCSSDSKLRDYHRIRLEEFQLSLLSAEAVEYPVVPRSGCRGRLLVRPR